MDKKLKKRILELVKTEKTVMKLVYKLQNEDPILSASYASGVIWNLIDNGILDWLPDCILEINEEK